MSATIERVTLKAPDISCGHCEATVVKALEGLEGVVSVRPSSVSKLVEIELDSAMVTVAELQKAMSQAGYPAEPVPSS